jgi:putative DNA-invertase from lambdoid prophage Rac
VGAAPPPLPVVIRTFINNMTFDGATTDPMQQAVRDARMAFMAATPQGTG